MRSLTMLRKYKFILLALVLAGFANASWSEEFYRWKDKNGVQHYGSKPPKGVAAKKVKVYGGKGRASGATSDVADNNKAEKNTPPETPEQAAERKKFQQAQSKDCKQERSRLSTLKANKPIRMKQPDGSLKYLSKEEVAKEIKRSEKYMSDLCS